MGRAVAFMLAGVLAGCAGKAGTRGVCEGSMLEPQIECPEGFCVNGPACEPIFDDCQGDTIAVLGGGCRHVGVPEDCWAGWVPDGDGGCEPVLPEGECPAGTMPVIGQADCQPVGPPTDCWEGWLPDGACGCEPILPAGDCPGGTMPIIGEPTCQPIADCSAPDLNAVYVDAAYAEPDPSDGTAARPYKLIQDGLENAPVGGQVVVATGDYDEDVTIDRAVRLEGRCAHVTVHGRGAADYAVLVADGSGAVELRGFTVTGLAGGIGVLGQTNVVIENVVVRDCEEAGLDAADAAIVTARRSLFANNRVAGASVHERATVTFEESVVSGTRAHMDGPFGYGVDVEGGSQAHLLGSLVTGSEGFGVYARASDVTVERSLLAENGSVGLYLRGSTGSLEETSVRDTRPAAFGAGRGVEIADASEAVVRRSCVDGNREVGVMVLGSTAIVDETVVRDTLPQADDLYGRGVGIEQGSVVTVSRSLVAGNRETGLWVAGSMASVAETTVRDTLPQEEGALAGWGVVVRNDASAFPRADVELHRCQVIGNREAGVSVAGSRATLSETVVSDTLAVSDTAAGPARKSLGYGVLIALGVETAAPSDVTILRSRVADNRYGGVVVIGSVASIEQTTVRDTRPQESDGLGGRGIDAEMAANGTPAAITVRDSLVAGNRDVGLFVSASTASVATTVVRDTLVRETDGRSGAGVLIQADRMTFDASTATIESCLVARNREAGVEVIGSHATVADSAVRDTLAWDDSDQWGDGLQVWRELPGDPPTSITFTRSVVLRSSRAGLYLRDATATVSGSAFRDNNIGVALEQGANPIFADDNAFHGNLTEEAFGRGLQTLPPPGPLGPP